jgi:hypothetical protein
MSGSAPNGHSPADDLENQACVALARDLEPRKARDEILQAALERAKEWRGHRKKVRRARYAVIANIFEIHVRASASASLRKEIRRECTRRGIRITKATHRTAALVKLILDPPPATVSQYSMALREAVLERIHPHELSARLAKKGDGIAALAARFAATHPKKRRVNRSDRDAMTIRREGVSFTWSKERLAFWNKLPVNDGVIRLLVLKQDSGKGAVIWAEGPFRQMPRLS